jgi:hypothetical protein
MLAKNATDHPPRIAWHIPPLLSMKEQRLRGYPCTKAEALD